MKGQKIRLNFNGREYTVKELAEITAGRYAQFIKLDQQYAEISNVISQQKV